MAFQTIRLTTYSITDTTVSVTAGEVDEVIAFDQDAEILAIYSKKPSNASSTLTVKVLPDIDIPSMELTLLAMGATDTENINQTAFVLKAGGRISVTTTNSGTGIRGATIYARVFPARGRGM